MHVATRNFARIYGRRLGSSVVSRFTRRYWNGLIRVTRVVSSVSRAPDETRIPSVTSWTLRKTSISPTVVVREIRFCHSDVGPVGLGFAYVCSIWLSQSYSPSSSSPIAAWFWISIGVGFGVSDIRPVRFCHTDVRCVGFRSSDVRRVGFGPSDICRIWFGFTYVGPVGLSSSDAERRHG